MSHANLSQHGVFLLTVAALVKPVGGYLRRVFEGEKTFLDWLMRPLGRWVYRLARVDLQHEMSRRKYASSFILFSGAGVAPLFLILRLQSSLPLFSRNAAFLTTPMTPDLARGNCWASSGRPTFRASGAKALSSRKWVMKPNHFIEMCPTSGPD